jgi:hypothetical protein
MSLTHAPIGRAACSRHVGCAPAGHLIAECRAKIDFFSASHVTLEPGSPNKKASYRVKSHDMPRRMRDSDSLLRSKRVRTHRLLFCHHLYFRRSKVMDVGEGNFVDLGGVTLTLTLIPCFTTPAEIKMMTKKPAMSFHSFQSQQGI